MYVWSDPLAGGFQPNLALVFVSQTLSNLQSFIERFRSCEVLKFPCCHRERSKAVLYTLLNAAALQVIDLCTSVRTDVLFRFFFLTTMII